MSIPFSTFERYLDEGCPELPDPLRLLVRKQVQAIPREEDDGFMNETAFKEALACFPWLLRDFVCRAIEFLTTEDLRGNGSEPIPSDQEFCPCVHTFPMPVDGMPGSLWEVPFRYMPDLAFVPADRSSELLGEALASDVLVDYRDAALQLSQEPGYRFWLATPEVLRDKGVSHEVLERYQETPDAPFPVVFLSTGLNADADMPFIQAIRKVLNGLGIAVGVFECRGRSIFPLDERVAFLKKAVRASLEFPIDLNRIVFAGHSLGGAVSSLALDDFFPSVFPDPFLIRVATSSHDPSLLQPFFEQDMTLFTGRVPASMPAGERPLDSSAVPHDRFSEIRQVYIYHAADPLCRREVYRLYEHQIGLTLPIGMRPHGCSTLTIDQLSAMAVEARSQGRPEHVAFLEQHVLNPHNFNAPRDQRLALQLMVSTVVPYLLLPNRRCGEEHAIYRDIPMAGLEMDGLGSAFASD